MEIVPRETEEPEDAYAKYPTEFYESLSPIAQTSKQYNKLPKKSERKTRFLDGLAEAFELCGGVPRLASWADNNYGAFVKAFGRTLPATASQISIHSKGPIQIVSAIPPSALDEDVQEIKDVSPSKENEDGSPVGLQLPNLG
jgi:hypothetical protein